MDLRTYLTVIRGAGDLASGIALRLRHAGFPVIMTETRQPMAVRRTVSFSEAVRLGAAKVEDVEAVLAHTAEEAKAEAFSGKIAVLIDEEGICIEKLRPAAVIDAIMAKKNTGTRITDAPVVIGVGPGFTAGKDCHAAVETKRGHTLGRALYEGSTIADTGIPGEIGGFSAERLLKAPADGIFYPMRQIGDRVVAGETAAVVRTAEKEYPVTCRINGVLRGLLPEGTPVAEGVKSGDIDPRDVPGYCEKVSDKSLAIGGGVLEAVMHFL